MAGKAAPAPLAEVNVTPLIDVLLVLLILFLLVTPAARRRLDTQVPRPAAAAARPEPPRAPLVAVGPQGLTLDGRPLLGLDDLELRLRERLAGAAERRVLVRAAGDVPYGEVVRVLDVARGAGGEQLALLPREPR